VPLKQRACPWHIRRAFGQIERILREKRWIWQVKLKIFSFSCNKIIRSCKISQTAPYPMRTPEQEYITLPENLRRQSLSREHYRGEELVGKQAAEFWETFIANNLPLIVCGSFVKYPRRVAAIHRTHPHDHPIRPNKTPLPEIINQLRGLDSFLTPDETAAISHTFGLSTELYDDKYPWDGSILNYAGLHTALIGIDLEPPPDKHFLSCLIDSFNKLEVPVVIFNTGGGYFATCLGKAYEDDFVLAQDYGKIAEEIIDRFEPKPSPLIREIIEGLKTCQTRLQLTTIAWIIEELTEHWGHSDAACVDFRHLKNSVLANDLRRGETEPAITTAEPFLSIQMYMRVGPKRGNDSPRIVYASRVVPFIIGKTIPFRD
jgi:hypothetical protein